MARQVKTYTVEVSDALCVLARNRGWAVERQRPAGNYAPVLLLCDDGRIGWNERMYDRHETITLEEAVQRLVKGPPAPDLMVGEWPVEFRDSGIHVGCEFVPAATVDAIYERLHEPRSEDQL